jgi:cyclic nucleotide-binding protein
MAPPIVLARNLNVTITPGIWHRFEVRGAEQGLWSVRLNGAEIIRISGVDDATLWSQVRSSSVVSEHGKQAIVAVLGSGDFLGERCLAGQPLRMTTATALTEASVVSVEKSAMIQVQKLGFIEFKEGLRVHSSLINVVLHDRAPGAFRQFPQLGEIRRSRVEIPVSPESCEAALRLLG